MNKKVMGKYVVADPKVCHGKLTFKGTRILVADVLDLFAQGTDWENHHSAMSRQHNVLPPSCTSSAWTTPA